MILEIAIDCLPDALSAVSHGADRLEVCSRLDLSGLTPSEALVRTLRRDTQVPLFVMIRPRGGDFIYSEEEFVEMERQIDNAKSWGVHGLVFGILRSDQTIDIERTRALVRLSAPLPVTFHRAFDRCPDLEVSAHALAEAGVKRILTSGGKASAEEGMVKLKEMVEWSNDVQVGSRQVLAGRVQERLIILPGGGVRPGNIRRILEFTGATEIHSAARNEVGKFEGELVEEMKKRVGSMQ